MTNLVNRHRRTGLEPVPPAPHLPPMAPRRAPEPCRREAPVTPARPGGVPGGVPGGTGGERPAGARRGEPSRGPRSSGSPRGSDRTAVHLPDPKRRKLLTLLLETHVKKKNRNRNRTLKLPLVSQMSMAPPGGQEG